MLCRASVLASHIVQNLAQTLIYERHVGAICKPNYMSFQLQNPIPSCTPLSK